MTTRTSTAAYSLMTCRQGESLEWNRPNMKYQSASHHDTPPPFKEKRRTCLMALAPTESMKLLVVQSRMMEWTALSGSRKTTTSEVVSLCSSSRWPLTPSSTWLLWGRTSWITASSLYWNQPQTWHGEELPLQTWSQMLPDVSLKEFILLFWETADISSDIDDTLSLKDPP